VKPPKHITPATILIDEHWRQLGLDVGWTLNQVMGLCECLKVTPWELGRLCNVRVIDMTKWLDAAARMEDRRSKGLAPEPRDHNFPTHISLMFHLLREWHLTQAGGRSRPVVPLDLVV
jgi:hypothetical protein